MDKLFAPFTEFAEGVQGAQSAEEVWALITALGCLPHLPMPLPYIKK